MQLSLAHSINGRPSIVRLLRVPTARTLLSYTQLSLCLHQFSPTCASLVVITIRANLLMATVPSGWPWMTRINHCYPLANKHLLRNRDFPFTTGSCYSSTQNRSKRFRKWLLGLAEPADGWELILRDKVKRSGNQDSRRKQQLRPMSGTPPQQARKTHKVGKSSYIPEREMPIS